MFLRQLCRVQDIFSSLPGHIPVQQPKKPEPSPDPKPKEPLRPFPSLYSKTGAVANADGPMFVGKEFVARKLPGPPSLPSFLASGSVAVSEGGVEVEEKKTVKF